MTKKKADFFKKVRDLRKAGYISRCWISEGKVFFLLKDDDTPKLISTEEEIETLKETITPKPKD